MLSTLNGCGVEGNRTFYGCPLGFDKEVRELSNTQEEVLLIGLSAYDNKHYRWKT